MIILILFNTSSGLNVVYNETNHQKMMHKFIETNSFFTGKTYFFKGNGFWKFNDLRMRVDHYEQKPSAPVWMGCKQNFEQNDLNQKLPYTGLSAGVSRTTAHSLWTISISLLAIFVTRAFLS